MIGTQQTPDGPSGTRSRRTRMCAVTRDVLPEAQLIRFVAAPDGTLVPDLKASLPGRGIWIGAWRGRVAEALRKGVFQRGLKRPLNTAADLPDQVARRLRDAALGRFSLARKAGSVLAGFGKVEAALGREPIAALVVAADAADDGVRKLRQALHRRFGEHVPFPVVRLFACEELSLAIGLPNVIHAAVLQGPAGTSFADAALRLRRYDDAGDGLSGEREPGRQDTIFGTSE